MDLVIDIGNSRTKMALFLGSRMVRSDVSATGDVAAITAFIGDDRIARSAMGSVANEDPVLIDHLRSIAPLLIITGSTPTPLRLNYTLPATLGADRLANAVGAANFFPGRAVLAIDLGTCVTYDVVDASGVYHGGIISPGLRMRAKAMHAYSARLPEVDPPENTTLIGTSTEESLASGAHHGVRAELRTLIEEIGQQHADLAVVLTGGDAPRFARALENGIFAHPFLTLFGLHAILEHITSAGDTAIAG